MNVENISCIIGFLYFCWRKWCNRFFRNDFSIQVKTSNYHHFNLYGCGTVFQMSLPIDVGLRHSDERYTKIFWTYPNPNDYFVFEFSISSDFNDRSCHADVSCVTANIFLNVKWVSVKYDSSSKMNSQSKIFLIK